ncbi:GMP synthase [glutamine-hydrolyzing], amidotransferase subunit (EC / GMP synthase [glutamine-hydrolyzing], ATP pyrophosphatase subunit (EC [Olavius algarvensis associated proteobacterium Delta 3]|nr:GMP synthase [glutamine-hydrolyzing], amidotransferase subunit (EC / GMP synthase [glutamine-hydrolyzing], ATP pyrophosphatase subunit (EC [Olavius algarvensis associated proteobacterium Delta 3]CAB5103415.1 GMP synthase [glutamine-hydrolyzing], amidotransferase subunit (EC / GMP synthase [glutamine-hydrolyzing], ATP pyrophosphatase subunit (EC [Olavius algarvensis associated proteobacterium Delta 3]
MILIVDFGSQYNQLIARRVRELRVYCRIEPPDITVESIRELQPDGIILSGGPASIYDKHSPRVDPQIFGLNIPILGICYGMQYMMDALGGTVKGAGKREYGHAEVLVRRPESLFKGVESTTPCWMSHGDSTTKLPKGFRITGSTKNTRIAAVEHPKKRLYGFQFHPEVLHTPKGKIMLRNFLFDVCDCPRNWTMSSFARESIRSIREETGDSKIILGLSGGVDSSVTALLIHQAVGKRLTCIFVDNGLLRKDEAKKLKTVFQQHLKINIRFVRAGKRFLSALSKVSNPEKKRKIIGKVFMDVFEAEAKKIKGAEFLGQGTLYPDVIESRSAFGGPSAVIKSHHNVGGLPKKMRLKLVEPLKYLFKDEVRKLGKTLGLPDELIWRQPFPGPGLAIRIIGEITRKRLEILREVDAVLLEEIRANGYYRKLWQSFAVLLPLKSVGIMGDQRTYEHIVAIRAVTSRDAMTADWAKLPHRLLGAISNRIINEVRGVNRVVYDISSKPPSTIEWE